MNTNSAIPGSYTKNPFWKQKFDLRQTSILRDGPPFVDFEAADNCLFHVTTMKAMNSQDDVPSIPIDNFKVHYVLLFGLTSMQDATENCHYPELVGAPLRLELSLTFSIEYVTELILLEDKCLCLQLTCLVLLEKLSKIDNVCFKQILQPHPLTQVSVTWFFSL